MITETHSPTALQTRARAAEQPLTGPARLLLIASATAVTLVFYLGCAVSLLLIGIGLLIEVCVALGLARVGLFGVMSRPMAAMSDLATAIAMSFWIGRGPQYTLVLQREDAPRLFQLVERLAQQVGVQPPSAIRLEMSGAARIELFGYRRGRGRTCLGLGYDLLVSLSEDELRAVIAHEMAHARLTQRGYDKWLFRALRRMSQLSARLEELRDTTHERGSRFFTAELLAAGADRLVRPGSRLVATYSRQDEFAADRLAADVVGAQPCRSALLTTAIVDPKSVALPWPERLAQADREECFSDWLRSRLLPRDDAEREELERRALLRNPPREFNMHPALADRLAALPESRAHAASHLPALGLLADPDDLAVRLLSEIECLADEQERKHTRWRLRQLRHQRRPMNFTGGQAVGVLLLILFGFPTVLIFAGLLCDLHSGRSAFPRVADRVMLGITASAAFLGICAVHVFRRRERTLLPLPSMSLWQTAMRSEERRLPIGDWWSSLETDMRRRQPCSLKSRKARARFWGEQCYRALHECRYRHAYVAARLCLEADRHCLDGLLGHGIAAAYLGQQQAAGDSLEQAVSAYGTGPSVSSAIGWAFCMAEVWDEAEMYLLDAVQRRPDEATLWSLLATCQWAQGKTSEPAFSLRKSIVLEPDQTAHRSLLVRLLLAAGRPREVLKELELLEPQHNEDPDLALGRARACLLLGQEEEAARWAAMLEQQQPGARTLLRLACAYAEAHLDEPARRYYERVCEIGFYPEAWVGLADAALNRHEEDAARSCLRTALDLTRQPGPDARGPLEVLEAFYSRLRAMNEPIDGCKAWTATLDLGASPAAVQRLSVLVCDTGLEAAREQVRWLYEAMHPGQVLSDAQLTWEPVAPGNEPKGPVSPGIYQHHVE